MYTFSLKKGDGGITKKDLISKISKSLKLLRAEYNYSQLEMATTIGLSKKTLIQIEKDRMVLGWGATCAVCAVFRASKLLLMELGEDPVNLIETLAHENLQEYADATNRNYVFWDVLLNNGEYILAKNILTDHYKITTSNGKKLRTSFDEAKITAEYEKIVKENKNESH